ncbi:MAG: 50S ribosomal protein L11 methyltransferase [Verrucomicrobiales bacterium]|nr:50S ribosomal protein L11 methyltransferase [Verrucomicrobiales bacterium]
MKAKKSNRPKAAKKPEALWALSLTVAPEAEDAAAELLFRETGTSAVVTHSKVTGLSTAVAYVPSATLWTPVLRRRLKEGLVALVECGLEVGPAGVTWKRVARTDWRDSWKRHFRPINIGRALLVRPSWSSRRAVPGQACVVLDPGLSFGTGQHPTTEFCLRELARRRPRAGEGRCAMLDVGTGSGILAIAAVKLGYGPVVAFDFDPDAVVVARRNAAKNRVDSKLRPVRKDVATLSRARRGRYRVVCANLTADLLVKYGEVLLSQVARGGHLVLAGILDEEFESVAARFEGWGARRVAERRGGEWRSGSFVVGAPS